MATTRSDTVAALTPLQWLICAIAAIGFAFDTYELLMLPLIVRPALVELLGAAPTAWRSTTGWARCSTCPPCAGGVFGLLGGYLTDLLRPPARPRPAASCSTDSRRLPPGSHLGRTSCCSCAAAPSSASASSSSPRSRGWRSSSTIRSSASGCIGYTQAFGSLGGLLVTRRLLPRPSRTRNLAGDPGRSRGLALHADVRCHARDSADAHPAVPAGIARLAGAKKRPAP